MKGKICVFLFLFLIVTGLALSQIGGRPRELRRAYVAPEEIVSMSRTMPFNQALQIFNDLSKKFLGKVIVDPESRTSPIGVDIDRMHWLDALELILRANKLWYEEYADYIKIVPLAEVTGVAAVPTAPTEEEKAKVEFESREVMISAVFFEADASKLKQYGFSWDFFRGKGVNLGVTMSAAEGKSGLFTIDVSPDLDFGSLVAVFKALESQQIGEVVANPRITVRSGQEGQIQVGSDVSTTVRDFAGNAITQFISTGSIIRVKPQVIRYDTIYFINLNLSIERSNAAQVAVGQIIINKSSAQTSVLLLDGEETIIGGLYVNEERTTREGVPILKDLPWWFFGLRYLFGFDVKTTVKKELIILLKAEILPTLAERLKERVEKVGERPTLREKREELLKALENYKRQLKSK